MDRLITVSDVAKMLNVVDMTIYRMVKNNAIPFVRVGTTDRSIRFDPSEIETWIKSNHKPAINEVKNTEGS